MTDSLELSPCGLVANSVFNDVFVVADAPDPYNPASPYEYMDESEISWVTGELILVYIYSIVLIVQYGAGAPPGARTVCVANLQSSSCKIYARAVYG